MPSAHSNPLLLFLQFVVALFFVAAIVGAEEEAAQLPNAPPVGAEQAVSRRSLGHVTNGACCYGDGNCTVTNETYCEDTLDGTFTSSFIGVETTCNSTLDPVVFPPGFDFPVCQSGSCCFGDDLEECDVVQSPFGCLSDVRGNFLRSFVPGGRCLDNNTCSLGACCTQKIVGGCVDDVYGGRCEDASEIGLDGTFLGEGTSCVNENGTLKEDVCEPDETPATTTMTTDEPDTTTATTTMTTDEMTATTTMTTDEPDTTMTTTTTTTSKLDRACGQECAHDSQCDSGCCFTPVKLKFGKPNVLPATPVGRCTEANWCECADRAQEQDGGDFRYFLRCVDGCLVGKSKKRAHKVL